MTLEKPPVWLFDLDNTLHDAALEVFPQISRNMNNWIASNLSQGSTRLSDAQADALRQVFWRRYGATLLGISQMPCDKATQFLKAAHCFDDLPSLIHAEKGLRRIFRKLPGKKILLTNSSVTYARQVLKILGLVPFFDNIISIEAMCLAGRYTPKPSRRFFWHLPAKLKVSPSRCILVEDDIRSLKAAKITGMKTVLVTQYLNRSFQSHHAYAHPGRKIASGRQSYVDTRIGSVRWLVRVNVVK
jgi:putative hydrolase of the HAD superfamily